ncbi:MAG: hypothetical protein HY562_02530 [Ignavibacteriales bacterium]|nr:hypothetical protein [Ignavibacteriales bacterium]
MTLLDQMPGQYTVEGTREQRILKLLLRNFGRKYAEVLIGRFLFHEVEDFPAGAAKMLKKEKNPKYTKACGDPAVFEF